MTFTGNSSQKLCLKGVTWSIKKFDRIMMAILTKVLAISNDPNKIFGSSSKFTIRFHDASCFVFKILMSLCVSEKKATSEPATTKDIINKKRIITARIVVACGLIAKNACDNL